jgi:hypothetical protein
MMTLATAAIVLLVLGAISLADQEISCTAQAEQARR